MSSKLGSYVLRKTIRTPKIPANDPFLPPAPATLHAKAEVTLSEADGLLHRQLKAVINLALPIDDTLSKPAARALVREEVIRVLRAMAEAMEASHDSSPGRLRAAWSCQLKGRPKIEHSGQPFIIGS